MSVARTIGDVYSKFPAFGGLPNVITHEPDIFKIQLYSNNKTKNYINYILLATDGVYDCFDSNTEISLIINSVLNNNNENNIKDSIHKLAGNAVDKLLKTCLMKKCNDNISAILICFKVNQ